VAENRNQALEVVGIVEARFALRGPAQGGSAQAAIPPDRMHPTCFPTMCICRMGFGPDPPHRPAPQWRFKRQHRPGNRDGIAKKDPPHYPSRAAG